MFLKCEYMHAKGTYPSTTPWLIRGLLTLELIIILFLSLETCHPLVLPACTRCVCVCVLK